MNPQIVSKPADCEKIDVDDIVNNNTKEANEAIVNKLNIVKTAIDKVHELRKDYVENRKMDINIFRNQIYSTYSNIKDDYETLLNSVIDNEYNSPIYSMIIRMIDSQIAVAKQEKSFKTEVQQFSEELHNTYVKPKLDQ